GYSRKELLAGKKYQELTPEEYHEWEAKLVEGVLTTGKPAEYEKEYIRKDGSRIPILLTVFVVKGEGGKPIGVAAIIKDITERKQAEDTLRQSEEKYKSLVSNVKLGVFRSTPEPLGKFLEVNPAMEEITGYHRKELLQMSVADLYVYPDERRLVLEEVASGKGRRTREVRLRKKDGTEILVLVRKVAVRDDADRILYFDGIMEDVTERKQAEEKEKELQKELNLASRLASVGQLAAGVAHEINNPLTAILAFSQRLLRKSTDDKVKRNLEIIHNEARRAAKVVENLLTFARRREPKIGYSNVNDILCRALELRAYELKTSNIKAVTDLAPSLPRVRVDFYQIEEVFLNIIVNAEQAMSEANGGGKLGIKTRETDGYIRVSFTDDGPGIPVEHSDKVFDPFFTTRGKKGGTGLGLSICHGIVQRHGGKIYVRSKPGKGATFVVELPIATKR
ncbi:MAG: PAS domain S-box protein, partial [Dehalococcoidales bacterium]